MRYFVFREDQSNKFWSIGYADNKMVREWGRIGTKPSNDSKYLDGASASIEIDKLINKKLSKNYIEIEKNNLENEIEIARLIGPQFKIVDVFDVIEQNADIIKIGDSKNSNEYFIILQNSWTKDFRYIHWSNNKAKEYRATIDNDVVHINNVVAVHNDNSDLLRGIRLSISNIVEIVQYLLPSRSINIDGQSSGNVVNLSQRVIDDTVISECAEKSNTTKSVINKMMNGRTIII